MKKHLLIAPRNAAREVPYGPDADRLLSSGSWVQVLQPKSRTRNAKNTAAFKQRCREAGYRPVNIFLPPHVFTELHEQRRKGETLAELIERLLGIEASKSKIKTLL